MVQTGPHTSCQPRERQSPLRPPPQRGELGAAAWRRSREDGTPAPACTKMPVVLSSHLKLKTQEKSCGPLSASHLLRRASFIRLLLPEKRIHTLLLTMMGWSLGPRLTSNPLTGLSAAFVPWDPFSRQLDPTFAGGTPLSAMPVCHPQDYKTLMAQGQQPRTLCRLVKRRGQGPGLQCVRA